MGKLNIGIIGAGAIGGVVATILTEKGYDVEIVCNKKTSNILLQDYVNIDVLGEFGEHSQLIKEVTSVRRFSSKKDIIFITTRANAVSECAQICAPHLTKSGIVVVAGNVLTYQDVQKYIPLSQLVSMFVEWSAEKVATSKIRVFKSGDIKIGVFDKLAKPFLPVVKGLLSHITNVEIVENMPEFIISRIIVNSAIASVGAITGLKLGRILENKFAKKLFYNLIKEGVSVFDGIGINIPNYLGKLDYYKFTENSLSGKRYANKLMKIMAKNNYHLTSSMLNDLDNNKKTEIDYLTGKICRLGKTKGIETPCSDNVVFLVKQIENGERTIYAHNAQEALKMKID